MKTKKILVIGIITFIAIMLLPTISKAGVESKPGGTIWKNISISNAYKVCYEMRESTSTLGVNSLDPHLALNKDWGAVAYLAISTYGAVKDKTGPTEVAVPGTETKYTSTTGNATGVMNFGIGTAYTYLAGAHETGLESASHPEYRTELITNKNSKYVELLPASANVDNTKGMAISETQGWYSSTARYCSAQYLCLLRTGVCGFSFGGDDSSASRLLRAVRTHLSHLGQPSGTKKSV